MSLAKANMIRTIISKIFISMFIPLSTKNSLENSETFSQAFEGYPPSIFPSTSGGTNRLAPGSLRYYFKATKKEYRSFLLMWEKDRMRVKLISKTPNSLIQYLLLSVNTPKPLFLLVL